MVIHFSIIKWLIVLQSVKLQKGILDDKLIVRVWQVHFLLGIEITETICNCVRGMRTQPVIGVGCCVHYWVSCAIDKGGFFRDCIRRRRHTFASPWGTCLRFASLWRANSRSDSRILGVHLSNVCWGLLFCLSKSFIFKSVLNLRKAYIFKSVLKVYYRSVFNKSSKAFIFQSMLKVYILSKILLKIKPWYFSLENVCFSWCMHQTGLFSSASVVLQSKFTSELWSSASVVPQSKSTELCR